MAERVASILAEIGIDASGFTSGASKVTGGLGEIIESFGATAFAASGIVGAMLEVVQVEFDLANQAAEAAQEQARLNIALENGKGAVGLTREELNKFATTMARTSGIEDDLVVHAEAVALTFQNLHGNVFKRTIQAAADLSAMFGGDLTSNTRKLGRALETFDGYTVLTREMGKFTDAQKDSLAKFKETNDLVGYQNYLLGILENKVGGAAKAVSDAGTGQDKMNVELKIFTDAMGALVLPQIQDFFTEMTSLLHVLNESIGVITVVYYALTNLYRIMLAIVTLGLSEVWRSIMSGKSPTEGWGPPTEQPTTPHAMGGSFIVPNSYGSEGFKLGNGDTASAGERITITPVGYAGGETVSVGNIYIGNTSDLSRSDIQQMIGNAFEHALRRQ
jgi:hypothetical protein